MNLGDNLRVKPEDMLQRFAILAMSGAGKSNTAAVMAEELYDASVPWVAIDPKGDWWGMRSSKTGKSGGLEVPVLGGLHGDIPLEPTAGALMAETIAAERLTCILDVSEFDSKNDQLKFLTDFATTLLKKNRDPLVVFAEEADEYLPQQVRPRMAECVGAWNKMVKRGRFRGVFTVLVSQRSAALNKDALNQTDTLIPMRVTAPLDRKAIEGWVLDKGVGRELLDSLSSLDDGEAWVWSPQKWKLTQRVKFRRRRTFDSGATPTLDGSRTTATLAKVDLDALSDRMAETIERAEADDPVRLRRRIAELELETQQPEVVEVEVEKLVYPEALQKQVDEAIDRMGDEAANFIETLGNIQEHNRRGWDFPVQPTVHPAYVEPTDASTDLPTTPPKAAEFRAADGEVTLLRGERKMLETLAQHYPTTLTRANLGTLAGFSPKGGTFRNYLGKLKRAGYVLDEGKVLTITQAGFDTLGTIPPAPQTPAERIEVWRDALLAGERKMLDVLILQGTWISREALGEQAGYEASGGTFRNYLGKLVRNGLAEKGPQGVRIGEALYV